MSPFGRCRRFFSKALGYQAVREGCPAPDVEKGMGRRNIVCIGNIKGAGQAFLKYCADRNTEE